MKLTTLFASSLLFAMSMTLLGCGDVSSQVGTSTEQSNIDETERQIYFSCQNIDSDIYLEDNFIKRQDFYIVSLEQLKVEDIVVTLPIETDYTVSVYEYFYDSVWTTQYLHEQEYQSISPGAFPFYLYQCYRDLDWSKLCQLELTLEKAKEEKGLFDVQEESDAYFAYRDLYLEDYQMLTKEELPIFYGYQATISFGSSDESKEIKKVTETFHTIDVTIGEDVYTQNIGEIRLHKGSLSEDMSENENMVYIYDKPEGIQSEFSTIFSNNGAPWGTGIGNALVQDFRAKEDLIINQLYLYESEIKPIQAFVVISDEKKYIEDNSDGDSDIPSSNIGRIEMYWDMKTPFTVPQGAYVYMELIFEDPRLKEFEYGGRMYPVMEYSIGENTYATWTDVKLDRDNRNQVWLRYAVAFGDNDKVDIESYYRDYYYPVYEDWLKDLPQ